jgi:hypothetical protein
LRPAPVSAKPTASPYRSGGPGALAVKGKSPKASTKQP